MGTLLDAIASVLGDAGTPLTVATITERLLSAGQLHPEGKTPAATVEAHLAMEVLRKGEGSLFVRTAPRTFGLRVSGVTAPPATAPAPAPLSASGRLAYTEAAAAVLGEVARGQPLSYQEITGRAITAGLLAPNGLTPVATMYSQLLMDIERRAKRADPPRFTRLGLETFGLASWKRVSLAADIAAHNAEIKRALHARLTGMEPREFQSLVGMLLDRLGIVEVVATNAADVDGADASGTLVVGDVMRIRLAVQIRGGKTNVQSTAVRGVRALLGVHDRGLIVAASDFSAGARLEASKPDLAPVALMNGKELVTLLIEHRIGVTLSTPGLFELAEAPDALSAPLPEGQ